MLILVSTAHPQALVHKGPGFGRLVHPKHYPRAAATAREGIPWAADNDCFRAFDRPAWTRMLDALEGLPGCLFVAVPDVVADAAATARRFERWAPLVEDRGLPVGLVIQNGLEDMGDWLDSVWERLTAIFVGGDTTWKLAPHAAAIVGRAVDDGLHVHMGRVNSRKRFGYARAIGCDSVDGSSFSQWRNTLLPRALTWQNDPVQLRFPV